jgi:hypothetical protein
MAKTPKKPKKKKAPSKYEEIFKFPEADTLEGMFRRAANTPKIIKKKK